MKKFVTITLCLLLFVGICACTGNTPNESGESSGPKSTEEYFYTLVVTSEEKLEIIGDDIYSCWYDAIYKDKYSGSIDIAIATALSNNQKNIDVVKENDAEIKSTYKKLKNSKVYDEIKAVMQAYNDYYEFVINVSGSFNSFSKDKETKRKLLLRL